MNKSLKSLSNITVWMKYAKFVENLGRREDFTEIMGIRNRGMHKKKFANNPEVLAEIDRVYDNFVQTGIVLPSMRSAQFAGKPIDINPTRIYNCSYGPVDHPAIFSEIMFLLLSGTGVGYSVQMKHIEQLPSIRKPVKRRRYLVGDSIEGWADAIKVLVSSYFYGKPLPKFDFSDIREKGTPLITAGGKAPGPEPLRNCLHHIKMIFERKKDGDQLSSLDAHDIICHIADAVLSGGIRRAACIALFDIHDQAMLTCKYGNWWERNPQRSRANNSAVILRHKFKEQDFFELWEKIKASGSGEPGIYLTNNADMLCNPCCEITLKPFSFCNLTEINMTKIKTQEEFNEAAKAAAFIGTLQASYTEFHYLRSIWKRNTEKESLIGVSQTGIASIGDTKLSNIEAAKCVTSTNKYWASVIGIKPAARTTCVKPSGTSSLVVGSSAGIHSWFDRFFLRRIRIGKNEALYKYLFKHFPEVLEDDFLKPHEQGIICIPVKAPEGAIVSTEEDPIQLLERIKYYHQTWIKPGHIKGDNTNNVSATIYVGKDDWDIVGKWMWINREYYNGLSILPKDDNTYTQPPYESITEEEYEKRYKNISNISLLDVKEEEDNTDLSGEVACAGGVCEIK